MNTAQIEWNTPVELREIQQINGINSIGRMVYAPEHNLVLAHNNSSYGLISNEFLVSEVKKNIDLKVEKEDYRFNGKKFNAFIAFDKVITNSDPKDKYQVGVTIGNSYDGSMSAYIALSFIRLICSNGMIAVDEISCLKFKHIGDFASNRVSNELSEEQFDTSLHNILRLKDIPLTEDNMKFAMDNIAKYLPIKMWESIIHRLVIYEKHKDSLFGLYMSMTYETSHTENKRFVDSISYAMLFNKLFQLAR